MEIEHGVSTGLENSLDEGIVFTQESRVEGSGSLIVSYHVLPSEGESEAIVSLISYNMEGRREVDVQIRSFR